MTVAVANESGTVDDREVVTDPPLVRIRGLGRVFETAAGPVTAVRAIDLDIRRREFLAIVGPSGCGKTTLLRMIAGLETPTSGRIETGSAAADRPVNAMVFQGHSVFPWMTVRQNAEYGLAIRGAGKPERAGIVDSLLETVGLIEFSRAYPHQLSEGMRQRVAIARALAVDPDLLLMDEPFGSLDEQTRFILQDEVLRIWGETQKTVIVVTHSIDEALTLADRVIVMTAHPGAIKDVVDVPLARPRDQATLRSDPEFGRLFGRIWDSLRSEVLEARAASGSPR
ncbi:MAG: ABC transporter ATP-binding protein [Thermomicrobiales bacterium]|nr:ABC transporter ATP-binding protein [Thermomicrobiales bacterium]MCO5222843.1 ABC transporter ATP-binding protein [Thermomicrobiales bacterium]